MALQWQTLDVPLAAGLVQRGDARAGNPPALDICTDVQFDEVGGVQTRFPYSSLSSAIYGGGALADVRKLVTYDDELLCFTKDKLYTWNAQRAEWVVKGEHLAVKVAERPQFVTAGEQTECDRAELGGLVMYSWTDASDAYYAVTDKETGSVLIEPQKIVDASRLRLVALDSVILVFVHHYVSAPASLTVSAFDPSSPAPIGAGVVILAAGTFGQQYDAVRIPGVDKAVVVAKLSLDTSYEVATVDAALTVTARTVARPCHGPIAVAVTPDAAHFQVVRKDVVFPALVLGDLLNASTLADVFVDTTIGTGADNVVQIACAYRSVPVAGDYTCHVFWQLGVSDVPVGIPDIGVKSNTITTANAVGPMALHPQLAFLGVASRAFDHDGRVYVNLVFYGADRTVGGAPLAALQNTYFLYRDDGLLVAKSAWQRSGGSISLDSVGHLPGVALVDVNTYAWAGTERRVVPTGGTTVDADYADRGPVDVHHTFDSDEARRCAQLGETLYIACGEGMLQYDGAEISEVGAHYFPYYFVVGAGGGGSMDAGTYAYKLTYRSQNHRGELDRSTTASIKTVLVGASGSATLATIPTLQVTHKGARDVVIEVWRTLRDQDVDAPYHLVSSNDPADEGALSNGYITNEELPLPIRDFTDALNDEDVAARELNPENGTILECLPAPPATIVIATESRLFLAGIAGDPDRVWYSRLRGAGEVASFHDSLTIDVPPSGGKITGLAYMGETLIVARETSLYAFPGEGFANDGSGQNYGPPRTLSADVGAVNHEGIAIISQGMIFKAPGAKGWQILDRGWNVSYIGATVCDFDDELPLAAHVLTNRHQVRIVTSARVLVWDTVANQWGQHTIAGAIGAAIFQGVYHYLSSTGPRYELTDYATADFGMDVETAWIKLSSGLQGMARVRRIVLLGEYRNAHALRIRIARDYKATATEVWDYYDDEYWLATSTVAGEPEQLRIGPSQQQCQAIKIRITVYGDELGAAPSGESVKLTGLALEVGAKGGTYSHLPVAQKT